MNNKGGMDTAVLGDVVQLNCNLYNRLKGGTKYEFRGKSLLFDTWVRVQHLDGFTFEDVDRKFLERISVHPEELTKDEHLILITDFLGRSAGSVVQYDGSVITDRVHVIDHDGQEISVRLNNLMKMPMESQPKPTFRDTLKTIIRKIVTFFKKIVP